MQNLTNIIIKLNNFDTYYEMSDSQRTYNEGRQSEREIQSLLNGCTENEIATIKAETTISEDMLLRYFRESFGTIEVTEEAKEVIQDTKLPSFIARKPKAKKENKLSTIMTTAWAFVKKGIFATISEALKAAWAKFKLVSKLSKSVAHFTYRKANGELREAIGTLRDGNFQYSFKGKEVKEKLDVIKYYDLVSDAWRSFRIERLVQA